MGYGMNSPGPRGPAGSAQQGNQAGMKEKIPSGYKKGAINNYTPEQHQLYQHALSFAGPDSYLSRLAGGDQSMFEEMEAPAMRQFQQLQSGLASQFSGAGMGARRGSGFQNAANQQTSDFAQDLASRRQGLQRQAIMDLMGLSHTLLGERPQQQFLIKKEHKQPFWKQMLGMISPIGGDIASGGTQNTRNFFSALTSMGGGSGGGQGMQWGNQGMYD
jgi:hypothetical protein